MVLNRIFLVLCLLFVSCCDEAYAQKQPDWITWTEWVASPPGRIWFATPAGQDWLKKQVWLDGLDPNQAPPQIKDDLIWLKSEFQKNKHAAPAIPIWPSLGCLGYFNFDYQNVAFSRVRQLAQTQGDVVLFIGDSLTQLWTDAVVSLKAPSCGNSQNSGVDYFNSMPGVKVNLGLYGIRTCPWVYEYDRYFRDELRPYSVRVKAVVINLGTNDIIQMANLAEDPKDQVKFISELIAMMSKDLPHAKFVVTSISPCLNAACGPSAVYRVSEFNREIVNELSGIAQTFMFDIPLLDMTADHVHFGPLGYQIIANVLAPFLKGFINTMPVSIPMCGVKHEL